VYSKKQCPVHYNLRQANMTEQRQRLWTQTAPGSNPSSAIGSMCHHGQDSFSETPFKLLSNGDEKACLASWGDLKVYPSYLVQYQAHSQRSKIYSYYH
jgi:hypothetical protein